MPNSVENAASELMGAAKNLKATFKGLTGVFKHLMEEHGKVGALLKRLSMTSDEKVRAELYPTIRQELLSHERGEVVAVYPVLAQFAETVAIAAEHGREADELKAAIADVDELSYSDTSWGPTFERLAELVAEHVKKEESEYFPKAQALLGEAQANVLLARFEAAKRP
jgi:hypothetical protein